MSGFILMFSGRPVGTLGIGQRVKTVIDATTPEQAYKRLYDRFEHVSGLRITCPDGRVLEPTGWGMGWELRQVRVPLARQVQHPSA